MKTIGIVAWKTGSNSLGVTAPYLRFISHFGRPRFILPSDVETFDPKEYDLIILPGGPDVNPERYGQLPAVDTGNPCLYREFFDNNMLDKAIKAETPIFGICRGHQTLNVFFGGTLKQHINTNAHGLNGDDRTEAVHGIMLSNTHTLTEHSLNAYRVSEINSIHHQVVTTDTIAKCFEPIAFHKSIRHHVEAMAHKELPIVSVQWHPEELEDSLSIALVRTLLNKTANESDGIKNVAVISEAQ